MKRENLPSFLANLADKILVTGKYVSAIRECGETVKYGATKTLAFTNNEREYAEIIENAYSIASKKLLDLLYERKLTDRLRYFVQVPTNAY